jgi:hypothetical protein
MSSKEFHDLPDDWIKEFIRMSADNARLRFEGAEADEQNEAEARAAGYPNLISLQQETAAEQYPEICFRPRRPRCLSAASSLGIFAKACAIFKKRLPSALKGLGGGTS